MAMAEKDAQQTAYWVDELWKLYTDMENGSEQMSPNAGTFALMLQTWHKYNSSSSNPIQSKLALHPIQLLEHMLNKEVSVVDVVADRTIASSDLASTILMSLSQAAIYLDKVAIVTELSRAQAIAAGEESTTDDEVTPVLRRKALSPEEIEQGVELPAEIPFNIKLLRNHLAHIAYARRVLPEDVGARQKHLETSVYEIARERMKEEHEYLESLGINAENRLKDSTLQSWMWQWHQNLKSRLESEIKLIAAFEAKMLNRHDQTTQLLSPYLALVKADRLSYITILELMRLQGSGGVNHGMKTTRALIAIGKAVEMEYKAQMCRTNDIAIPTMTGHSTNFFSVLGYSNLQKRRMAAARHMQDGEAWTTPWSQAVRSKIGGILVECLMDVAYVRRQRDDQVTGKSVTEDQPAFYHAYEYVRGTKLGILKLNPAVAERLSTDRLRETIHPRHLPMLVPPKPWMHIRQGGYLYNKTSVMRFKESIEQETYLQKAIDDGKMELVLAGLDVLGSTPWRINKNVYEVVLKVWNSGERMGKIPPAVYDQPAPEIPENYEKDLQARSVHLQRQKSYTQGKANNHSERCNVNYKIEIARAFLHDELYMPHNLDFRGRAYPIPPHLSHIGDDLCRGLLLFADAKPLGERGLWWLKIHLANLYGYDKASFQERADWVMERLDDIADSATNPLDGKRWWTKGDDPWQVLAACMELHAALQSEDPLAYMSTLPVHQDGTCNGLQHYAALGGDAVGAKQVNLAAGDRPSDVYSYVGRLVDQQIEADAANGLEMAKLLQGKITRKVVKQTVMTTVYGVTFVGAREQIEKQLKDRHDIPDELCWTAASYLAKKVLTCIGDTFTGAKHIQNWLNLCARLISKSIAPDRFIDAIAAPKKRGRPAVAMSRFKKEQMTSVVWTTPLQLPIIQPYRKHARKQVMTAVQSVFISDPSSPAEVNSLKQASAFPPNFIHSLDATHMMLTALECHSRGLTFASVHDSYWTHASTIDSMAEVIRDTFILLHSSDVLGKLHEEFKERFKGFKLPLIHLQNKGGNLVKMLSESGVRIVATPEQAKSLESIAAIVEVSETGSSAIGEQPIASEGDPTLDQAFLEQLDEEDDSIDDEWEGKRKKAVAANMAREAQATRELLGKFVDVVDLLPPLPEKGTFRVQEIKSSPYFFS